jgi:glycosyltransferase involved in cell wall biosynthesis
MTSTSDARVELSVIIPTYNRADFVQEAVASVLAQDYWQAHPAGEILVVDDGSTDDTEAVLEPWADMVAYVHRPHTGVSAARNLGLKLTRGEWVAFLDSDDLWKPEKISRQMQFFAAHPDAVVVCTEETWIRRGVFVNPKIKHRKYSGRVFDKFLPLCLLSLSSALFRRRVFDEIGGFDEDLPACEDYDLGLRLAHRYPVHFIPEPLIVKRGGHVDQLSKKYWGMDRFRVKALEKALDWDLSSGEESLVEQELQRKCRILIQGAVKRGKIRRAEAYRRLLQRHGLEP